MSFEFSEEFIPIETKSKLSKLLTQFEIVQYGHEDAIQFVSKEENRQQSEIYTKNMSEIISVIAFIQNNLDRLVYEIKKLPSNSQNRIEVLRNFILEDPQFQVKDVEFTIPGIDLKFTRLLSFPVSKRPITDMTRFWRKYESITRQMIDMSTIPVSMKLLPNNSASILYDSPPRVIHDQLFYIPILRYEGMSRNTHYIPDKSSSEESNNEPDISYEELSSNSDEIVVAVDEVPEGGYCGTFFYYEAESPAYLKTRHLCIAVNKINAFKVLGMSFDELFAMWEDQFVTEDAIYLYKPIEALLGVPENKLMKTYVKPNIESGKRRIVPVTTTPLQPLRPLVMQLFRKMFDLEYPYTSFIVELYSLEDFFDQGLCRYAKEKGIDTVILTNMTGGSRNVSEVLETRDRATLFNEMVINRI